MRRTHCNRVNSTYQVESRSILTGVTTSFHYASTLTVYNENKKAGVKNGFAHVTLLGLQGCVFSIVDWVTPTEGYALQEDIAYGNSTRQRLAVYVPQKLNSKVLTILFFYGGAWASGNKQDYRFVAQARSKEGY